MAYYIYSPKIAVYASPGAQAAGVTYATVRRLADAAGRQCYYDYGYWYGNRAQIYPFQYEWQVPAGYYHCKILTKAEDGPSSMDADSVGGYHWTSPGLVPYMRVGYAGVGQNQARSLTHEILEFMYNPYAGSSYGNCGYWSIWSPQGYKNSSCTDYYPYYGQMRTGWYAQESCDPVWNWEYDYPVSASVGGGQVRVTDFVTPQWFTRDYYNAGYRNIWYDKLGRLSQPFQFSWYQTGCQAGGQAFC